ncbi:SGNH/GDSL hydrolase family protein (plasmid) [Arthrobacter sp. G.S.26]|uniref:SGNH/GDSL hydrolase family protein n=1 Tax=Arthrobacter sp. G.S.26 TaxID=3433706 RepID=UPI003D77A904
MKAGTTVLTLAQQSEMLALRQLYMRKLEVHMAETPPGAEMAVRDKIAACIIGAISMENTPAGISIHRSSPRTRAQLADPAFDFPSATPSGVRIDAITTAEWIEVDLALTRFRMLGESLHATSVDLIVDGELRPSLPITSTTVISADRAGRGMTVERAVPQTLRFDLGRSGVDRRVEIWLPHAAAAVLVDARLPEGATLRRTEQTDRVWAHYGSSISHCSEVERPTQTWPAIVARRSGHSLINLGLGGQCHLDQGMARTIRDLNADAISLEIGINIAGGDTMRERTFTSAFHGFLDTVREGAHDAPILIISPIYCRALEDNPGPVYWDAEGAMHATERPESLLPGTLSLTRVRELLTQHVAIRREDGDKNLHLLNGLDLFGADDSGDLPDDLHPNTNGYARIAKRMYPVAFGEKGVLR